MRKKKYSLIVTLLFISSLGKAQNKDAVPAYNSFTIDSKLVNEKRVINVWAPPNYKEGKESLPVLYMPDGGIKEDFPHIANTLAKLIENKSIPPFILVGIENTIRRRDLTGSSEVKKDGKYCPITDGATNFRAFILKELVPEINNKYRTTSKKGIIGESLAGLFVMETFLLRSETFDFYIAMDPSLWWNNHELVRNSSSHLVDLSDNEIKLWYAGSSAKDISRYTKKLEESLQDNASEKLVWKYSEEPKEKHNTIFRAVKEKALIWTLNDFRK